MQQTDHLTPDSVLARWQAFHFFYHDRQDPLLENLLRPLVVTLLKRRVIDSFFFVRSQLGGPHVRLRLRLHPLAGEDAVADALEDEAGPFFNASPSRATIAEEEIRKINQGILQSDPSETDQTVYPDNSVWAAPFRPEVERYGGPRLFLESLGFFAVSSCEVLHFLHQQAGDPGAKLLPFAFHLLGRQALGLARDSKEFLDLIRYPVRSWELTPPSLVERGDQVFEQQKATLLQVLRQTIEELATEEPPQKDMEAARRLGWALQTSRSRPMILGNQLHMTANRLGLRNAEEVYVARLLWRTALELGRSEPPLWDRLGRALSDRAAPPPSPPSIEGLLPAVLGDLGRSTGG